jgi:hypothetical protein
VRDWLCILGWSESCELRRISNYGRPQDRLRKGARRKSDLHPYRGRSLRAKNLSLWEFLNCPLKTGYLRMPNLSITRL